MKLCLTKSSVAIVTVPACTGERGSKGGVVREPLVSVREKFASICNYMQGLRLWRNNGETMAKQWRNKFATAGFSRGATADDTWLLASVFVNTTWPLRLNALEVCGSA